MIEVQYFNSFTGGIFLLLLDKNTIYSSDYRRQHMRLKLEQKNLW